MQTASCNYRCPWELTIISAAAAGVVKTIYIKLITHEEDPTCQSSSFISRRRHWPCPCTAVNPLLDEAKNN